MGAALFALGTYINIERNAQGNWTVKVKKQPTDPKVDIRLTHSKKPVAEHRVIRAPGVIEQVAPSAYDAGADAIGRRTRRKPGWRHRGRATELSV